MSIAICAAESANYADAITQIANTNGNGISDNLGLWQINDFYHTDGIGASTSSSDQQNRRAGPDGSRQVSSPAASARISGAAHAFACGHQNQST